MTSGFEPATYWLVATLLRAPVGGVIYYIKNVYPGTE
jgi:hypothetical protein